jgi:hypothetical protein
MSGDPVLSDQIALLKVRTYLSGLRGYPSRPEGEALLARTLQGCTISIRHADAVLETFDHACPTPHEMKETAFNLRTRFEPPPKPDIEKWKAEGATYDPTFYRRLMEEFGTKRQNYDAELWRAIKTRFYFQRSNKTTQLLRRIIDREIPKLSWSFLKSCKRQLGFPLNAYEKRIADEWDEAFGLPESMPQRPPITGDNLQ